MTVAERNARRVSERRNAEAADALHFVVFGHDEHLEHGCLFAEVCSRSYNPMPYPEATPEPAAWYVNTGVGALYGLPGWQAFAPDLAGWNVVIPEPQYEEAEDGD